MRFLEELRKIEIEEIRGVTNNIKKLWELEQEKLKHYRFIIMFVNKTNSKGIEIAIKSLHRIEKIIEEQTKIVERLYGELKESRKEEGQLEKELKVIRKSITKLLSLLPSDTRKRIEREIAL